MNTHKQQRHDARVSQLPPSTALGELLEEVSKRVSHYVSIQLPRGLRDNDPQLSPPPSFSQLAHCASELRTQTQAYQASNNTTSACRVYQNMVLLGNRLEEVARNISPLWVMEAPAPE